MSTKRKQKRAAARHSLAAKAASEELDDAGQAPDVVEYSDEYLLAEELRGSGFSTSRTIAALRKKFGMSEATAYRRMAQVKAAWALVTEEARPVHKARATAGVLEAIRAALSAKPVQAGAAIQGWRAYAAMHGLDEPLEIRGADKALDLSRLTIEERAAMRALILKAKAGEPEA